MNPGERHQMCIGVTRPSSSQSSIQGVVLVCQIQIVRCDQNVSRLSVQHHQCCYMVKGHIVYHTCNFKGHPYKSGQGQIHAGTVPVMAQIWAHAPLFWIPYYTLVLLVSMLGTMQRYIFRIAVKHFNLPLQLHPKLSQSMKTPPDPPIITIIQT